MRVVSHHCQGRDSDVDVGDQRGIIPRSIEEIFRYIHNTASPTVRFLVRASYLQIYNEVISDLLKPERTNLTIREDKKRGVFVEGLSEWVVRSPAEIYGARNGDPLFGFGFGLNCCMNIVSMILSVVSIAARVAMRIRIFPLSLTPSVFLLVRHVVAHDHPVHRSPPPQV